MGRKLKMEECSESKASFQQFWELANDSEFHARREARDEQDKESLPCLSLHTEHEMPLQNKHGFPFYPAQDTLLEHDLHLQDPELHLQSAREKQQEEEEEKEETKLNSNHDSSLMLRSKGETTRDVTCADFDLLLQEMHHLLQRGESEIQEKGEKGNQQVSPYSLLLRRIKDKSIEDLTCADFDTLLLEESYIKAGQHQLKDEKQEVKKKEGPAPSLLEIKAAEPYHPQITSPRHQEEEAAHSFTFKSFSPDFKLTPNPFFLALNVFISGDRLQSKQWNLNNFCKLQPTSPSEEVHKRGEEEEEGDERAYSRESLLLCRTFLGVGVG